MMFSDHSNSYATVGSYECSCNMVVFPVGNNDYVSIYFIVTMKKNARHLLTGHLQCIRGGVFW